MIRELRHWTLTLVLITSISVCASDTTEILKMIRGKSIENQMFILDSVTRKNRGSDPVLAMFTARKNWPLLKGAPKDSATFFRLNLVAKVFRDQGLFNEALLVFNIMKQQVPGATPGMLFEFYNSRGTYFRYNSTFDLAYSDYIAALTVSEKHGKEEWVAIATNNLGGVLMTLERLKEAIEMYDRSYKMYLKLGNNVNAALCRDNIGMSYYLMNDFQTALREHLATRDILMKEPGYYQSKCTNAMNLGLCYKSLEQYEESRRFFKNALVYGDSAHNYANSGLVYLNMADLELTAGNLKEAEHLLRRFMVLLKDTLGTMQGMESAYLMMSQLYIDKGVKDSAKLMLKRYQVLKDSLYSEDIASSIGQYQSLYDNEKKESQILLLEKEKENQALILYGVSGGAALMGILALILIRSNRMRRRTNKLLETQNSIIEEKNKDITDSINYARRIQSALQPSASLLKEHFPESFILQQPRDIVSGDFYWFARIHDRMFLAVADCTGHGVPGALMSMVGMNFLEETVRESWESHPAAILNQLHDKVVRAMNPDITQRTSMDGMDVALISLDQNGHLGFAGAVRPLALVRQGALTVFKGDRYSVGGVKDMTTPFTSHSITLEKGDRVFLFSDGYADQFGMNGKKFMVKKFYALLERISKASATEQERTLLQSFREWKGTVPQTDDILVAGFQY